MKKVPIMFGEIYMSIYRFFISFLVLFFVIGQTGVYAHSGQEKSLHDYSSFELWNPGLFIGVILVFIIYLFSINNHRKNNANSSPISVKRKFAFFMGLIVFFIALGTPVHVLGDDFLFSAHMLEQSLIYIVMPPLLLVGLENWMIQPILNILSKYKFIAILKFPLIGLILFNVLFSFYHIPFIFDTLVSNTIYHNLTHLVITISAFLMWIPILPVVNELDKLSSLQKLGYIFGAGILLTPACALIIFADEPMYRVYSNSPQLFTYLGPLEDQQTGGIIMKLIQELIYGSLIGYIFFKWAKKEQFEEYQPKINDV